jgi:UDP-N-acetylmuramoylalanine--D-glutamate ligase
MRIAGRSFSVVGMGKSGLAAARLLGRLGGDVVLSDRSDSPALRRAADGLPSPVRVVFGEEVIRPGDVAVLSPGIAPHAPAFREANRVADEVIGEVELFFRLFPGRVLAVTGTDGKSTTTTLAAHLLRAAGIPAAAAGNLGNPVCDLVGELGPADVVVAEVSCFQLLTCSRFRPVVALVTNLAEDHTEHHGSFEAYVAAKARVLARQAAGDTFVRNLDDPLLAGWCRPGADVHGNGQRLLDVRRGGEVADGAFAAGGAFWVAAAGRATRVCDRAAFGPVGDHNVENAALALAACLPFGAAPGALAAGLASYRGLAHRIEPVGEIDGVRFYNDSKATNPHAAITGLRAFGQPVVLLAGGHEKGLALDELAVEVGRHCAAVVLVGESAARMAREFPAGVPTEILPDLAAGTRRALELARGVGVVLFSPAASSFDRFRDFEERGDRFRDIVAALAAERG